MRVGAWSQRHALHVHRTKLNRTVRHVRKWARCKNVHPKFGGCYPLKRRDESGYFWLIYDDITTCANVLET